MKQQYAHKPQDLHQASFRFDPPDSYLEEFRCFSPSRELGWGWKDASLKATFSRCSTSRKVSNIIFLGLLRVADENHPSTLTKVPRSLLNRAHLAQFSAFLISLAFRMPFQDSTASH